jgi:hypothetical protein
MTAYTIERGQNECRTNQYFTTAKVAGTGRSQRHCPIKHHQLTAQRKVSKLLLDDVGNLLYGERPSLVVGPRLL